jgi:hydroxypyruvate reductase
MSETSNHRDASQRALLRSLYQTAVQAAQADNCVGSFLPALPENRTVVLGAGKAAAAMARAVETEWSGRLEGLVIVPYGHGIDCRQIEVVEAAHPLPDQAGLEATRRILELAQDLGSDDLALCLVSGGGSSLMAFPAPGWTLEDKRRVTDELIRSGAPIREINKVRREMSAIKGGRLAEACHPARVVTLAISDVVGDDPSIIASGPTYLDSTTTVSESDSDGMGDRYTVVASSSRSIAAALELANARGFDAENLGQLEGSCASIADRLLDAITEVCKSRVSSPRPILLLSGGEANIRVRGSGRGGPNSQLLLELLSRLRDPGGIWILSADTDGIDGTGPHAGGVVSPTSLLRASDRGLDLAAAIDTSDSLGFLSAIGDELITGPTLTNVNDFRALLIE